MPQSEGNAYDSDGEDTDTPWKFSGFMKIGRWYPSIVPLMDGRMVIVVSLARRSSELWLVVFQ